MGGNAASLGPAFMTPVTLGSPSFGVPPLSVNIELSPHAPEHVRVTVLPLWLLYSQPQCVVCLSQPHEYHPLATTTIFPPWGACVLRVLAYLLHNTSQS